MRTLNWELGLLYELESKLLKGVYMAFRVWDLGFRVWDLGFRV